MFHSATTRENTFAKSMSSRQAKNQQRSIFSDVTFTRRLVSLHVFSFNYAHHNDGLLQSIEAQRAH